MGYQSRTNSTFYPTGLQAEDHQGPSQQNRTYQLQRGAAAGHGAGARNADRGCGNVVQGVAGIRRGSLACCVKGEGGGVAQPLQATAVQGVETEVTVGRKHNTAVRIQPATVQGTGHTHGPLHKHKSIVE
jgi:hypothetical protein